MWDKLGLDADLVGFSNARMAYDDVISRVALFIERGSLDEKITSADLIELYRSDAPLGAETYHIVLESLKIFGEAGNFLRGGGRRQRFNKATLATWLMFTVRCLVRDHRGFTPQLLAKFIRYFEEAQTIATLNSYQVASLVSSDWLFKTYQARSTARVADVSSVLLRDAALWLVFHDFVDELEDRVGLPEIDKLRAAFTSEAPEPDAVARGLVDHRWGQLV